MYYGYYFYYAAFWLYILAAVIFGPVVCLFSWLSLALAKRRRLTSHVSWLMPFAIHATINMITILLIVALTVFRMRSYPSQALAYFLSVVGSPFGATAAVRLWKMLRDLPASPGHALREPSGQDNTGIWPPPPTRGI